MQSNKKNINPYELNYNSILIKKKKSLIFIKWKTEIRFSGI